MVAGHRIALLLGALALGAGAPLVVVDGRSRARELNTDGLIVEDGDFIIDDPGIRDVDVLGPSLGKLEIDLTPYDADQPRRRYIEPPKAQDPAEVTRQTSAAEAKRLCKQAKRLKI